MNDNDLNQPKQAGMPDEFERAWMDTLAAPDPELDATCDAFVARVIDKHRASQSGPAVAGRVYSTVLPYAAAAAIAVVAVAGWLLMNQSTNSDGPTHLVQQPEAEQQNDPLQPEQQATVVPPDAKPVPLGRLIAQTRKTVTRPADGLTTVVRDTPDTLQVRRLFDMLNNPMPDLEELLAPLNPNEQQSRA